MPARKHRTDESKYIARTAVEPTTVPITLNELAFRVPGIILKLGTSAIQQNISRPDWKLYRVKIEDGVAYIVREYCERCGTVKLYPAQRKLRVAYDEDFGPIYLDAGICKDCINASVYVDKYLDGEALSEKDAKALFYSYAEDYERAWRMVIAAAPRVAITKQEWRKACNFFNGCSVCGGRIEVQAKYFPAQFNGAHSAWNVIPMCEECFKRHKAGRLGQVAKSKRYRIFSSQSQFQKTKTCRLYLLRQMELHGIYMDPLYEWRKRFFETKTLPGSD